MKLKDSPVPAGDHPDEVRVKVGDQAPDFRLMSTDGKPVRLADLRGEWVVLYFYPENDTPGCTIEARRFRDYFEAISIHDAAVLGVSRDTHENHCHFRDNNALPFELLSDEDGAVHDLYGAWRRPLLRRDVVYARRCTFLIDPAGLVAKVYPKVNPVSHAQQVVHDLEAIAPSYKRQLAA